MNKIQKLDVSCALSDTQEALRIIRKMTEFSKEEMVEILEGIESRLKDALK